MKIKITNEIKKDIINGVNEAERIVNKEMAISFDLRNHDIVRKYNDYIKEMSDSIKRGYLG